MCKGVWPKAAHLPCHKKQVFVQNTLQALFRVAHRAAHALFP
jgi:hypothetical protein